MVLVRKFVPPGAKILPPALFVRFLMKHAHLVYATRNSTVSTMRKGTDYDPRPLPWRLWPHCPNAAGKTTLLRKLHAQGNASIAPSAADATFAGYTVADHLVCAR